MRSRAIRLFLTMAILIASLLIQQPAFAEDLTVKSLGDYGNVTVMEASGNYDAKNPDGSVNTTPRRIVTKEFFKTHRDEYDFVVVFTNFKFQMPNSGSKAFYLGVKNDTQGIGKDPFDHTALFGSSGRLQGMIDMGNIGSLTTDPLDPNFENTLYLLSHELMHRWGAFVWYQDGNGNNSSGLLGSADHWSCLLSADSVLYGNRWQDNGNGTFTSLGKGTNYGPLDLYLMGLIDKSGVPPMLLIDNPGIDPTQKPVAGVTINGTAKYVTIDDIIAANGERVPAAALSQKNFRIAFILLTRPGTYEEAELYGIESIRNGAAAHFSAQTYGKGIMTLSSAPTETIPQNPGIGTTQLPPRTRTADVNEALTWLLSRQYPDGHWEDSPETAIRDTAVAAEMLAQYNWSYPWIRASFSNAIGWLESASPKNTDDTARMIVPLRHAGRFPEDLVRRLASEQNPDYGWGSGKNFASNAMDTGLALRALPLYWAGEIALAGAIDYLEAAQNLEGYSRAIGGWGVNSEAASGILPTATAMLGYYNGLNALHRSGDCPHCGAARNWLASKQDIDGGFGRGPSAVYETAIVVLTLYHAYDDPTYVDPACIFGADYLRTSQAENGSWNDSVYQTALALHALSHTDFSADLGIVSGDIGISPAVVTTIPEEITITANIWNSGYRAAPGTVVALYDGAPALGVKIAEQTVSFAAAPNSITTVSFTTTVSNAIEHTYFISIDPQNTLEEKTKANNIAWKTLPVNVTGPIVGFSAPASSGSESISPVQIPVTLNTSAALPVTVGYSVNPSSTATSGSDYTLAAGSLAFAPGETVKYIDLTIIDDMLAEASETLVIDLVNPVNAVPGQNSHTYTILDNDVMPVVTILSPLSGIITSTNTPTLLYTATPANVATTVMVDDRIVNKTSGSRLDEMNNTAHTLRVEASDGVNTSFAVVVFTINYTPPVVTLRSPVSSVYTDTTPLIRYSVSKEATIVVKVDGAGVDKISGDSLDALTPGEHIVRVEATDEGGVTGFAEIAFIVYTGAQQTYALSSSVQLPVEMSGSFNTGRRVKGVTYDAFHTIYTVSDNGCNSTDSSLRVTKYDSSVNKEWARPFSSYSGGTQCADAAGIAVNAIGGVYVHVNNDSGLLTYPNFGNEGHDDAYLMKLNKEGVLEWALQSLATGDADWADSVSIGLDGYIYAAGRTAYSIHNPQYGFWRKYDPSGAYVAGTEWNLGSYNGTNYLSGVAKVTADVDGNVYVAGYTDASPNAGPTDVFAMSFTSDGTVRWAYQAGTAGRDVGTDLAVDDLGGVYIMGSTEGGMEGNTSSGGRDVFLTKLDSSTGARQWTYQLGSTADDDGYSIAAEKNGILYLTGASGGVIAGADGSGRVFVLKGDGSGNSQFVPYWVKQFGTTGVGKDISLGALGYVYVRENDAAAKMNTLHTLRHPRLPAASLHQNTMHAVGSSLTVTGTMAGATGIASVKTDTNATGGLATYPTSSTWQVTVSGLKPGNNHLAVTTEKNTEGFRDTVYGTIKIVDTLPVITTSTLPAGISWSGPYNQTLTATGGMPPYTWAVTSGSLPPNLNLASGTGVISGWLASAGTYTFTAQVADAYGWTDAKALSIGVYDPMVITTESLPSGSIGVAYSHTLAATGGLQPYAWSIVSGALPAGLALDRATGAISGVPLADGLSSINVQVSDVNNFTTTKTLALNIDSKVFTSFAIQNIASNGIIDAASKTISVTVPYGTDVTYMIATFSTTGTSVTVGSAIQVSGITANNFSTPLAYTVTAVDGSTATYTVTITLAQYSPTISTIAGNGSSEYGGDNGPALQASFGYVYSSVVSTSGTIYISDSDNYRIRKFTAGGTISTVAGNGTSGFSGDGGQARNARIGYLDSAPAIDRAGNLYIADGENHRIRKISTSGIITTIAGTGQAGFSGDGEQAVNARMNFPTGVAVDSTGNLYVTDSGNRRIRKISGGIITTIAGNGQGGFSGDGGLALEATFGIPQTFPFYGPPAIDNAGNIYIVDIMNYRIRKVDGNGIITTIAGNGLQDYGGDGGPATLASFGWLDSAPVIDAMGNIYFADTKNNRVRKIDANGIITTIAGNGQVGFSGDGDQASFAVFNSPSGVALGGSGDMYITDAENYRIRKIAGSAGNGPVISTASLPSSVIGAPYNRTLGAIGGRSPYTWSIVTGSLCSGLTLSSSSGVISGAATSAGTSSFTVQVRDADNATNTRPLSIAILTPPSISTSSLASGITGSVYSQTLTAVNGTPPYLWSTLSGSLPAGLSLNGSSGIISGTPTSAGTLTIIFRVTDVLNSSGARTLELTIYNQLSITTTTLESGVTGTLYDQTLAATGGKTPYTWSITSGSLSSGLVLSTTSGKITGTPTSAGTSTFAVQVKDANNIIDARQLSIGIYSPLDITTTTLASGMTGSAYGQTLAAIGGLMPYVWSTSSGTLPAGLTLSSDGVISGNPTSAGTSTVMYKVTDANSRTSTKSLGITINSPITAVTITASPGSPQVVNTPVTFTAAATGGVNKEYQFAVQAPGGAMTVIQQYGPSNTFPYTPTTAGTYSIRVFARNTGTPATYEAARWFLYDVFAGSPITAVSFTAGPGSPQAVNTPVLLTATPTGGGANIEYQFAVQAPGGVMTVIQQYGPSNTFPYTPTTAGTYSIRVFARNVGTPANYEAARWLLYDVLAGSLITAVSFTAGPVSPQAVNTPVLFTATPTGGGANIEYQFAVQAPGGVMTVIQQYGPSNTFPYTPTTAGTYSFRVFARNVGTPANYEAARWSVYTVTP